jgi:hypothetical protein
VLRSTWLLIALFVISVLPTTVVALGFAAIGLPFWVAAFGDLLLGNVALSTVRLDMSLLIITAPFGLVGVYCLWRVFWLVLRHRTIVNPGRLALGLLAGVVAGTHLLFAKIPLLVLALPATIFALAHLRAAHRHHALHGAA